jgi:hypothetical protein
MGRKKKKPHWREAARLALEEKAAQGDIKSIKLLESMSPEGGRTAAGPPRAAETELLAIAAVTFPWFETRTQPPEDPEELRASWHLLRNRVRYLEQQRSYEGDLKHLVVFQYRQLKRDTCPHCRKEFDPRPFKPHPEEDSHRARVLARVLRECDELEIEERLRREREGPSPGAPKPADEGDQPFGQGPPDRRPGDAGGGPGPQRVTR